MMMPPNSKPRAAGTPRSQPDAGVYPPTTSVNPRQDFLPPIGQNSSSRNVVPPGRRDTETLLVGDFCFSSDLRSRFKTHSRNIIYAG
jgi:hypothetical protein